MRGFILLFSVILVGCATTPKVEWHNPNLEGYAVQQQFYVDDGHCIQASVGAVQMPAPRTDIPGQSSYAIRGEARTTGHYLGSTTTQYQATVTQQPPFSLPSFSQGFAAAKADSQHDRALRDAQEQRERVYRGCMASLGWILRQRE